MLPETLAELLKLPPSDRVEIAMALWDSLWDDGREAELALTPEQEVELDRRLEEHAADPHRRYRGRTRAEAGGLRSERIVVRPQAQAHSKAAAK